MTSVLSLAASTVLGGADLSGHLLSAKRTGNLVRISQAFELAYDRTCPAVAVGATAVIGEAGTTVLTGFVEAVHYLADPERGMIVSGRDNFWRAEEYYLFDPTLIAQGETVAFWVGHLCTLCGLTYVLTSSGGALTIGSVTDAVSFDQMSAADALKQICALPGWNMRVTAGGVLEFITLTDSSDAADEVFATLQSGTHTRSDQQVRNQVKIWGVDAATGEQLLYQARRDVAGITPDRTMVVSTPNIQTVAQATTLATKLLDHFANIDEISDAVLPAGSPTRVLGMIGQLTVEPGKTQLSILTDLESVVDRSGYVQSVAIGRKNFWLPYYPPVHTKPGPAPIVCTDGGVLWSWSSGVTPNVVLHNDDDIESCRSVAANSLWAFGCGRQKVTDGGLGLLKKFDAATGSLAWAVTFTWRSDAWALCDETHLFLVFAGADTPGDSARIEERSIADGSLLWSAEFTSSSHGAIFAKGVALDANAIYIGGQASSTFFVCARSRADGSPLWEQAIPLNPPGGGSGICYRLVSDGSSMYATGYNDWGTANYSEVVLYARFDAVTGSLTWSVQDSSLGLNGFGYPQYDNFGTGIGLYGGSVYILIAGAGSRLRQVNASDGSLVADASLGLAATPWQHLVASQYGVFPFYEQGFYDDFYGSWVVHADRWTLDLATQVWHSVFDTPKANDIRQACALVSNQLYIGYPGGVGGYGFTVRKFCTFTYP